MAGQLMQSVNKGRWAQGTECSPSKEGPISGFQELPCKNGGLKLLTFFFTEKPEIWIVVKCPAFKIRALIQNEPSYQLTTTTTTKCWCDSSLLLSFAIYGVCYHAIHIYRESSDYKVQY